jgi:ATP-dependent Lon protease
MNPVFYFDELDKVSNSDRGHEIINLLIHLTDYTQNTQFLDQYMDGISVDLSKAMFVFSFNDRKLISPILLDRMEIIQFHSYSNKQKIHIARNYLLPDITKQYFGNKQITINITNAAIYKIIKNMNSKNSFKDNMKGCIKKKKRQNTMQKIITNNKSGVRYIKKSLDRLVSRINLQLICNNKHDESFVNNKITITSKKVSKVLYIK